MDKKEQVAELSELSELAFMPETLDDPLYRNT